MFPIPLVKQFRTKAPQLLKLLSTKPESHWVKRGEVQALKLFSAMAKRVPAYKDFLKKNGIRNPGSVRAVGDISKLPIASKDNYLLQYPLEKLCWDGMFKERQWVISSTSGSTGQPFYFPRTVMQDEQFGLTAELSLRAYFGIDKKSTLFINCFAMGVWVGGVFVYQAVKHIAERGEYGLFIITPGADKTEALKAVKSLAPKVDQVIICGYGPLVKDLIDEGVVQGIDWSKYDMKYLFAAEGFTEGFRDYMQARGGASDIFGGTLNMYGTADLGAMAHETPLSIFIRRYAQKNSAFYPKLFAHRRLPTFCQYIPELYYFEEVDQRLVCSAPGGLPLMRYDLKDVGQVHGYEDTLELLRESGHDVSREMKKEKIGHAKWNVPFVSVFERNDFTVSIYSVNIYPESIRKALEDVRLRKAVSGKFTMIVDYDKKNNQYLEIHTELLPSVADTDRLRTDVLAAITQSLIAENSEWKDFYMKEDIRHKVTPRITFWPYQHPTYFKSGGKQKWVKKQKTP